MDDDTGVAVRTATDTLPQVTPAGEAGHDDTARFAAGLRARLDSADIPSLNGLRAIAVMMVLLYHGGLSVPALAAGTGVMLFFVLSGFLITWLLLKEADQQGRVSFANFYIRRSLRIFPAFYAFWILVLALMFLTDRPVHWGHALSTFFYFSNYYYPFAANTMDHFDHAWSLGVEEQFYLLWPAVLVLIQRRWPSSLVRILVGAIAVVVVYRAALAWNGVPERYLYRAFDTRADHLLVGCLLAVTLYKGLGMSLWRRLCRPAAVVAVIALLELSLWLDFRPTDNATLFRFTIGHAVEPLLLAVLIVQAIQLGGQALNNRPIAFVGRISYGLYLFHMIGFAVSRRVLPDAGMPPQLLLGIGLTFGLALASYVAIERPALRLKAVLQRPAPPRPAVR